MTKNEFAQTFKSLAEYHDKKVKEAVLSFYYEKLSNFDANIFNKAATFLKTTKKIGQFPTVAEFEQACRDTDRDSRKEFYSSSMTEWESTPEDIQFGKDCLRLIFAIIDRNGDSLNLFKRDWFNEIKDKYKDKKHILKSISSLEGDIMPIMGEQYVQDSDF